MPVMTITSGMIYIFNFIPECITIIVGEAFKDAGFDERCYNENEIRKENI